MPVEGKTFELLEEMYVEFSEFRKESGQRFEDTKINKLFAKVSIHDSKFKE